MTTPATTVRCTLLGAERDVTVTVECQPEDLPVRGNAMASGDDAADRATEDAILADLDAGNQWAWCSVCVRVAWTAPSGRTYHASSHLGACSYTDEATFRADGYFDDMVAGAMGQLDDDLRAERADLSSLDPATEEAP